MISALILAVVAVVGVDALVTDAKVRRHLVEQRRQLRQVRRDVARLRITVARLRVHVADSDDYAADQALTLDELARSVGDLVLAADRHPCTRRPLVPLDPRQVDA